MNSISGDQSYRVVIRLIAKVHLCLLLVCTLGWPLSSHSIEELPTVINKEFAKGMLLGILSEKLRDVTPDFRDDGIRRRVFSCFVPPMNAAVDRLFPDGVTELPAAVFRDRLDTTKTFESLVNDDSKNCLVALKQQIEKDKQSSNPSIPLMDLDDLRTDMASLSGRKVRVKAVGYYVMNMFMLKKNPTDMSPLFVDISKVQRDRRLQILQRCSDILTGCRVNVYGTVGKVNYQAGIDAEEVALQ